MNLDEAAHAFREFVAVIQALRKPETGCPWDLEQDHRTLRPFIVEEAYEVLDAIDRSDDPEMREELGDLLLQVVLHAQVADDRGAFAITEVIRGITAKMVRRHPHVFGATRVRGSDEVLQNWEQIKAAERHEKGTMQDALGGLPPGLPALLQAQRLCEKAAKVGFDWATIAEAFDKVREEFAELEAEVQSASSRADTAQGVPEELKARLDHELGDLLFTLCQLARHLDLNAEDSLRVCSRRFVERFQRMEQLAPRPLTELNRTELLAAWQQTKAATTRA